MTKTKLNEEIDLMIRDASEKLTTPSVRTNQGQAQYWSGYRRALTDLKLRLQEVQEGKVTK